MNIEQEERFGIRPSVIDRVIYIGSYIEKYIKKPLKIFCKIEYKGNKLSITGVINPTSNGNAESCGQILDTIKESIDAIEYSKDWDNIKAFQFVEYWKEWHLNDMQAGCKHQIEEKWCDKLIDDSKPKTQDNMRTWKSYEGEKSKGLLSKSCKVCGYKYGTKWLHKDVPTEILKWLNDLPKNSRDPVWI